MGDIKLNIEAESLKDVFEDLVSTFEEMGAIVVKPLEDPPEAVEKIFQSKGYFLYKPGEGVSKNLIKAIAEEDQEELIHFVLANPDTRQRILELLEEKNYKITKPEQEDWR